MLIKWAFPPFFFGFFWVKSVTNLVTFFSVSWLGKRVIICSSFRWKDSAPELSQVLLVTCAPGITSRQFQPLTIAAQSTVRLPTD